MNNSTMNFTRLETSTNSTNNFIGVITVLDSYIYSLNVLFGFPTHSYIIWLIVIGAGSGVASDFFILNLSVSEIGNCLNSLVFVFSYFTGFSYLRLTGFLLGLLVTGRPLFQCLMCVECYLAVVHPVTFLKYKSLRYRVICCTVAWIIILDSCLCCMFTTEQFNYELYIYFYSIQFLLYFSIQLFCLVAVLRALKQSGPGERGREIKEENHMKRRAFHLILIATVTMTNIYVPLIISGFYFIHTRQFIGTFFSVGLFFFSWLVLFSLFFICAELESFPAFVVFSHLNGYIFNSEYFTLCFSFQKYYVTIICSVVSPAIEIIVFCSKPFQDKISLCLMK